jgi:hypothetical protein
MLRERLHPPCLIALPELMPRAYASVNQRNGDCRHRTEFGVFFKDFRAPLAVAYVCTNAESTTDTWGQMITFMSRLVPVVAPIDEPPMSLPWVAVLLLSSGRQRPDLVAWIATAAKCLVWAALDEDVDI